MYVWGERGEEVVTNSRMWVWQLELVDEIEVVSSEREEVEDERHGCWVLWWWWW